ncbi:MAG: hypothetical protein RLZZ517_40 [Candidatus Parcubacteria bacterium]|jgi:hypothetical protein
MKIKHYPRRHLANIRNALKEIIDMSHKNRIDATSAASCELMAEDIPSARQLQLEVAQGLRERIAERNARIEALKKWVEKRSPRFFEKVTFVQGYITTWDLDLPAIRHAPVVVAHPRKKHSEELTLEKRTAHLERRRSAMKQWYCFFFGTSHLESHSLFEKD